jgi:hypothetical protein
MKKILKVNRNPDYPDNPDRVDIMPEGKGFQDV